MTNKPGPGLPRVVMRERVRAARGHLPAPDVLASAVEVFKALGNPQRLSIIHALSHEEMTVGDLAHALDMSLTVVSQHLAILRRLALVAGRDAGRRTFYRVIDDVVSHLVHDCLEHVGGGEVAPPRPARRGGRRPAAGLAAILVVLAHAHVARADDGYLLDHPDAAWWVSAQLNVIGQAQPGFHAPYTGDNSFRSDDHTATSAIATVYAGYELTAGTAIVIAGESAAGGGLSDALGIAGFSNVDVVRNPTLGAAPYLARAFVDQVIPLSDRRLPHDRDPLHLLRTLPGRRIEIRAGKLSTVDVFDTNTVGSDSHLQFMNWAAVNNAAYDYAADTRGYTLGVTIAYAEPTWSLQLGELAMPTVANGIDYDTDLDHARGENAELELHGELAGHPTAIRLLGFANHARMGRYADAIAAFERGDAATPDITASRTAGRIKYGFGLNAERELTDQLHGFLRIGWNEGHYESFAYTEVDNTIALGADLRGTPWRRAGDKLGVAAVSSGLSDDHRRYLALGGKGFLLGDGQLRYGRETFVEAYYTARVYRGVFAATDVQLIARPGYNRDRGPVAIGSLRLHVEL